MLWEMQGGVFFVEGGTWVNERQNCLLFTASAGGNDQPDSVLAPPHQPPVMDQTLDT